MTATTTQAIARLHREITRLAQEGRTHPVLAARRLTQIDVLYAAIARLREVAA